MQNIVISLSKQALDVHNFCEELNSSMYRNELFNLAIDLGLKVNSQTTKKELCQQIGELLIQYHLEPKFNPEGATHCIKNISPSLRRKIDYSFDHLGPPANWFQLLYGEARDLIGLDNFFFIHDKPYSKEWLSIISPGNADTYTDTDTDTNSEESNTNNDIDFDKLLSIISTISEKDIKQSIEERIELLYDEVYDENNRIDFEFTDADKMEILALHKSITNGCINLEDQIPI